MLRPKLLLLSVAASLCLSPLWAEGGGSPTPTPPKGAPAQPDDNNPMYLNFGEMGIPIIQNRRVKGILTLSITLDLGTGESRKKVEPYRSYLKDKVFWELYNTYAVTWTPDLRVDMQDIKNKTMKIVHKYFSPEEVKDALVFDFRNIVRKDA